MDIKLTLENKQLYPAVINLRQFSNNTDIIKFEMPDYMYETTDLSKMPCYAVCDMGGNIDEVKLTTELVENKLRITWKVTGYTTQKDGHINYLIAFKDIKNEESVLWFSHQGIIFVNSSIDADGYIAAKYPSILQQWEERMNSVDSSNQERFDDLVNKTNKTVGDLVEDVNEKVESGFFDGKTILYGEGIPAKTLGKIGDVYVNTAKTPLYPHYLFTKDGADWTPRWCMKGASADTLPLLGTLFIPESEPIPPGYEEVTDFHIPSSWIGEFDYTFQGKIDALSNPNLLINGDFSVWQRNNGKKDYYFTTENSEVKVISDRWFFITNSNEPKIISVVGKSSGNIEISNNGTNSVGVSYQQRVELTENIKKRLTNEKVTLSFRMKSTIPFECGAYLSFRTTDMTSVGTLLKSFNVTSEFVVYQFTFEMNKPYVSNYTGLEVRLFGSSKKIPAGAKVELDYVKLEFGDFATPFVPRLYAEELQLCRRYYQNFNEYQSMEVPNGNIDSKVLVFNYGFSVPMRVKPKLIIDSTQFANGLYRVTTGDYYAVQKIDDLCSKDTFYIGVNSVDNLPTGFRYKLMGACITGIDAEIA